MNVSRVVQMAMYTIFIAAGVILLANPMGLRPILFFGQRPPYHWADVLEPREHTAGSVRLDYVGSNGRACAEVYRFALIDDFYTVYGYGFSRHGVATLDRAKAIAEHECG